MIGEKRTMMTKRWLVGCCCFVVVDGSGDHILTPPCVLRPWLAYTHEVYGPTWANPFIDFSMSDWLPTNKHSGWVVPIHTYLFEPTPSAKDNFLIDRGSAKSWRMRTGWTLCRSTSCMLHTPAAKSMPIPTAGRVA